MTSRAMPVPRRWIALPFVLAALAVAACDKASGPVPAFTVSGMTCASCTVTVRKAATGVDGVYAARADVEQGRAWVSYDSERTNSGAIAQAITAAGYEATPIQPSRRR